MQIYMPLDVKLPVKFFKYVFFASFFIKYYFRYTRTAVINNFNFSLCHNKLQQEHNMTYRNQKIRHYNCY